MNGESVLVVGRMSKKMIEVTTLLAKEDKLELAEGVGELWVGGHGVYVCDEREEEREREVDGG